MMPVIPAPISKVSLKKIVSDSCLDQAIAIAGCVCTCLYWRCRAKPVHTVLQGLVRFVFSKVSMWPTTSLVLKVILFSNELYAPYLDLPSRLKKKASFYNKISMKIKIKH